MGQILLLATTRTYRAGAFLDAARELGVPVTVGSERPQSLASLNPKGHLTLPFHRPDEAVALVARFHASHPVDAVVAADDDGVVLGALAGAALGHPHNPVAAVRACRNKHEMRRVLASASLPGPTFEAFSLGEEPAEVARRVEYPCVLKPLALSASQGVIRADDAAQFQVAWRRIARILDASRGTDALSDEVLVESFLPGREVALEGLLTGGELRVLALFDKPDPLDGPFFEETLYVTPSRLALEVQDEVVQATAHAAQALGLRHGPVHAELRVHHDGARLLELAPRSIGGLCSRALRFESTAPLRQWGRPFSLEEVLLRHALGREVESLQREKPASGVMMIPIPRLGTLRRIHGRDQARQVPGVEEVRLTIPVGQRVVPLPEGNRYLGFLFARDDSPRGVERALRRAHERLEFEIEGQEP